jgi:hypothetical protein
LKAKIVSSTQENALAHYVQRQVAGLASGGSEFSGHFRCSGHSGCSGFWIFRLVDGPPMKTIETFWSFAANKVAIFLYPMGQINSWKIHM